MDYYQPQGNPYLNQQQIQQQRLQAMQMQYNQPMQYQQPQQQMQMQPQQPQQPTNVIKPVTSLDEVRGITPDFSGAKMYFEDVTNNKMYVKYMDLDGLPKTKVYTIDNTPTEKSDTVVSSEYVNKQEFEELKAKIEQYEGIINNFIMQGGAKNE